MYQAELVTIRYLFLGGNAVPWSALVALLIIRVHDRLTL